MMRVKRAKKIFSRFAAAFAAAMYLLTPLGAWATEIDLSTFSGDQNITIAANSGDVTLKDTFGASFATFKPAVLVESGYTGTITLNGVDIDRANTTYMSNPITLGVGASPNIVLVGNNVLTASGGYAGLNVPDGAEVRISGTGKLTAITDEVPFSGAGIGGNDRQKAGIISIAGGHVVATGSYGSEGPSAGIGGGTSSSMDSGDGGTVTIAGGIVEATAGGSGAQDIGKGANAKTAGTTTIIGGSVKATNVDDPENANGTAVVMTSHNLSGYEGKTLFFEVADSTSYTYPFDVPSDGTAYLWVPNGSTVPNDVATAIVSAAATDSRIELTATATGGTPTAWNWYRADSPDGPFAKIDGATTAAYTDASVENGKTYYYAVLPIVSGMFYTRSDVASATSYSPVATPGPASLNLSMLTVAPGTLTPAFDPETEKYSVEVSYNVDMVTVSATAASPDETTVAIDGTTGGLKAISLDAGVNGVVVKVTDKSDTTKSRDYAIAAARGKRLIEDDKAPDGVDVFIVESGLPNGIVPITDIPSGSTVSSTDKPADGATPGYLPLGDGSVTFDIPANEGEGLGLAHSVAASSLGASFDNWAAMSDADRLDLILELEEAGFSVVYEYVNVPGKTYAVLVGAESAIAHDGGPLTWKKAIDQKIIRLDSAGITLNYVVTDGTGDPYVSGGFIVLPDGVADGRLIDPIWFMNKERKADEPSGSGGGVGCTAGAGAALALGLLAAALAGSRRKK